LKKTLIIGFVTALSACATEHNGYNPYLFEQKYVPANMGAYVVPADVQPQGVVEIVIPETVCPCQQVVPIVTDPCKCRQNVAPREVLRPRIKEVVQTKPRRNCPAQSQKINCGCGECEVMLPTAQVELKEIIPQMPEAYELASLRVFNRFIKDTFDIYSKKPDVSLYAQSAEIFSDDLPEGVAQGVELFKNNVTTSHTFVLENEKDKADYVLKTSADWFDTPTKTVPAIKYVVTLSDKNGKVINEWVEIVKKAENSQKWL